MDKTKLALGVALVAMVIAIGGYFFPQIKGSVLSFGGVTNYDEVDVDALRVGSGCGAGSSSCVAPRLDLVAVGTCSLIAPSFTVAASTTVSMDCAVSGVTSGDFVFAQFATSTTLGNGWAINGASASTTAGYATFRVTNWTGASGIIPASLASSTQYQAYSTRSTVPGL